MVLEYQTKVLGKSVESANRFIKNLIADKELEAEAKETKTLLDKDLEEQAEALKTEAEETKKANEKAIKDSQLLFAKNVNELVNKATDIPADEKQQLIKVLTKFDKQLKNGAKVNEFYFKFAEFKKDLPNYIKLVRLVMNPEKFMKSLKNEGKTETAEKVFRMGRTANSKKKVKTNTSSSEEGGSKKSGFRLL
jgi:aminopeptidase C